MPFLAQDDFVCGYYQALHQNVWIESTKAYVIL